MERVAGALMLVLLVAPMLGSFAGVLVDRLPAGRPVAFDPSRCACGRTPAAGAWLGPAALPQVVLLAACGALAWAVVSRQLSRTVELPFGSFLAAAIWIVWLVVNRSGVPW